MSGGVDRRGERRGYKAWRYYKCDRKRREGNVVCPDQHHVGADKLEQRAIQIVLERILAPEHVAHICAEMQERLVGAVWRRRSRALTAGSPAFGGAWRICST